MKTLDYVHNVCIMHNNIIHIYIYLLFIIFAKNIHSFRL